MRLSCTFVSVLCVVLLFTLAAPVSARWALFQRLPKLRLTGWPTGTRRPWS